jgi:hypothetical protein
LSMQASQTALSKWRAGGQNQIGGAIQGNATLTYTRRRPKLKATLSTQYGIRTCGPHPTFRKTQTPRCLKRPRKLLLQSFIASLATHLQLFP